MSCADGRWEGGLADYPRDAYRTKFRAGAGNLEAQREPFRQMIAQLRAKGYDKVGAAGFCWGGNIVALTPELDAHGMIHPGAQTNADAAEKLEHPTCLLPSQNEDEETVRTSTRALAIHLPWRNRDREAARGLREADIVCDHRWRDSTR